jgi:dTDP-4-amino-4,6-dideoxygalactose transaminase
VKVPITRTVFDRNDRLAVQRPLRDGWVSQGRYVRRFEGSVARFTGARNAVAVSSGTAGLHLALAALDLPGDAEVVVPAFSWVATAGVVEHRGARPIFCDIDLETFNLDPAALEAAITRRTRAILPVHLFGWPADLDAILSIARRKRLHVVEDAACALGTYYRARHVGTFGDLGVLSFHPRKAVTTGEGGMVLARQRRVARVIQSLRNHGADGPGDTWLPDHGRLGYNYRMTDLQGALGVSQMRKLPWVLARRARLAARYRALLAGLDWLALPPTSERRSVHGHQSFVCLFRPRTPALGNVERLHRRRNRLMLRLKRAGIATRQGTHAIHALGYYRRTYGLRPRDFPSAWIADRLSIALPLYPHMTDAEQDHVVRQLERSYPA